MLLVLYLLLSLLWHKRLIIIIKAVDMKLTILANFRILPSSYLKTAACAVTVVVVVAVVVVVIVAVSIAVVMAITAVTCFISRQRKVVATNAVIITAATAAAVATPNDLGSRNQIMGFWYRIYRTVCSSRTTASIAGVAGAQQISPVYMAAIMIGIKA